MVYLMPQAQCGEAMLLAGVRSYVEQAVFIMGQTSKCCMVYLPDATCTVWISDAVSSCHVLSRAGSVHHGADQ